MAKLYYVERCVDCGAYLGKHEIPENHPNMDVPGMIEDGYRATPEEFQERWDRPPCNLRQGFKHAGTTGGYVVVE